MKRCLVDLNVWFALLVRHHEHHQRAAAWFDRCETEEAALCRQTQLGLLRLLGNRTILQDRAVSALEAWNLIERLLEDERVELIPEPAGVEELLPILLRYPVPTAKLVGDAYLAAFAMAGGFGFVSFDRGFREFRGLRCELL